MNADSPRLRRLPFVAAPVEGESFPSWMDRTAIALGAPTGVLAVTIGLRARPSSERVVADYGLHISDAGAAEVAEQALLTPAQVQGMHLVAYDGRVLRLPDFGDGNPGAAQQIALREWVLPHGSRACARCLAERPVWKLKWKLSLSAVCTVHETALLDTCGRGHALLLTSGGKARPLSRTRMSTPTRCGAVSSHGVCQVDLTREYRPVAAVPAAVMELQSRIDETIDGHAVTLAGRSLKPLAFHDQLRGLVALMRHARTAPTGVMLPDDARVVFEEHLATPIVGGGVSGYSARPRTAVMAIAILAALAPMVVAGDDDELLARLKLVTDSSNRRRIESGHNPLRRVVLPDVISRAIGPTYPHARVARHSHLPRREPSGKNTNTTAGVTTWADLAAGHIPQLLPASIYQDHIRTHLPGTAELTGRRFASLALARLAGAPSWGKAAVSLGGDPARGTHLADVLSRRLRDPENFWAALDAAAEHLGGAGVDYRARERALRRLREVDPRRLPDEARLAFVPWTRPRRRHAATWVWVEVGGGDPRASPASELLMKAASRESTVEGWRRFRSQLPPVTRRALHDLGITLCEENP